MKFNHPCRRQSEQSTFAFRETPVYEGKWLCQSYFAHLALIAAFACFLRAAGVSDFALAFPPIIPPADPIALMCSSGTCPHKEKRIQPTLGTLPDH